MKLLTFKLWTLRVVALFYVGLAAANMLAACWQNALSRAVLKSDAACGIWLLGIAICCWAFYVFIGFADEAEVELYKLKAEAREVALRAEVAAYNALCKRRTEAYYRWVGLGLDSDKANELANADIYDPFVLIDREQAGEVIHYTPTLVDVMDDVFQQIAPEYITAAEMREEHAADQQQIEALAEPSAELDTTEEEYYARHLVYLQAGGKYGAVVTESNHELPWLTRS